MQLVKVGFHKESDALDHIKSMVIVEVLDYILTTGGVSQVNNANVQSDNDD